MGYQTLDDLYLLSPEEIRKHGGRALLDKMFDGSVVKVLCHVYPEHKWLAWKFIQHVPFGFWDSKENQKAYFHWLGEEVGIQQKEDWYRVSQSQIINLGGSRLLTKYRNSPMILIMSLLQEET